MVAQPLIALPCRFMYTAICLAIFLVCSQIPLYGVKSIGGSVTTHPWWPPQPMRLAVCLRGGGHFGEQGSVWRRPMSNPAQPPCLAWRGWVQGGARVGVAVGR